MRDTERERHLDLILARLSAVIRERGFTQADVQKALGWGRSYIDQLMSKQKSLRVDQVEMILNAIDSDVGQFWGDVYGLGERPADAVGVDEPGNVDAETYHLGMLWEALVDALRDKGLISAEDLAGAIRKAKALDQV